MGSKTVKESSLVVSYALSPVDANPSGNIHGGVIMKEIDTAAAIVRLPSFTIKRCHRLD